MIGEADGRRFVVVGASGRTGARVVRRLAALALDVRAVFHHQRDLPGAAALPKGSATCADVLDPATLGPCFRGGWACIYLAGAPGVASPGAGRWAVEIQGLHNAALAARAAGCLRFLYVSARRVEGRWDAGFARLKHAAEEVLHDSGLDTLVVQVAQLHDVPAPEPMLVLTPSSQHSRAAPLARDALAALLVGAAIHGFPAGATVDAADPVTPLPAHGLDAALASLRALPPQPRRVRAPGPLGHQTVNVDLLG